MFTYIDGYYNRVRRHSSIDYKSPMKFEEELKKKKREEVNMPDFCVRF